MSKPIYEPSLPRTDAELGYGRDQLFRRPAPATDIPPIPWIRRGKTASQSIPSGANDTQVTWSNVDNAYPTYFSTPIADRIRVLQNGVYEVRIEFVWDANKVEGSILTLNSPQFQWNKGWWDEQNAGHTIEHNQVASYRRRMVANTEMRVFVVHFALVARSILEANWEVQYVGSYTGTNPLSASPPE